MATEGEVREALKLFEEKLEQSYRLSIELGSRVKRFGAKVARPKLSRTVKAKKKK